MRIDFDCVIEFYEKKVLEVYAFTELDDGVDKVIVNSLECL
jgi:hypothetical protein